MDVIFSETSAPITSIIVKVYDEDERTVRTYTTSAAAVTRASYDLDLRVLVVDQWCDLGMPFLKDCLIWLMPARRTLETHGTAALAIRRAVELADDYEDHLSKTVIDDDRTDDEVKMIGEALAGIPF